MNFINNVFGRWTKVKWESKTGWVYGGYLKMFTQSHIKSIKTTWDNAVKYCNEFHLKLFENSMNIEDMKSAKNSLFDVYEDSILRVLKNGRHVWLSESFEYAMVIRGKQNIRFRVYYNGGETDRKYVICR